MMKKSLLLGFATLILFSLLPQTALAQSRKMDLVDYENRKTEYIANEAGLTEEEAIKFFPVFNELNKKKFALHKGHREIIEKIKSGKDSISDEEYRKMLEKDADVKLKEAELDKEYSVKLEKVLSPEKIYKAQQAERKFMQQELQRFRRSE